MYRIAVPIVAVALCWSCKRAPAAEQTALEPHVQVVAVAEAQPADLVNELVLTAEFRPNQEIEVHAKIAGYLKEIKVDAGDHVQAGQLLATLEVPELKDDLNRAEANHRRSIAEVARAKDELERTQSAHQVSHLGYMRLAAVLKTRPNLVAQQEIDEAMGRDRVSEAQVASTRSGLASAEQQVQVTEAEIERVKTMTTFSRITAPFAGVISKRYADTGAMIQAGTASQTQAMPLVRLSEDDRLRLILPVPESNVPGIHVGEAVEVRVPALQRTFKGRVARFSGKVQSNTRTMETEVDVANPTRVLVPGMYAEARLTLERHPGALAVPVQAVDHGETQSTAMVVNAARQVERRVVKLGMETPTRVEITSGLAKGDQVVIGSRSTLKPGQPVEARLREAH